MIPIVAVVTEDTFHAINDHSTTVDVPPAWREVMERNGWTTEMLVAGTLIKQMLEVPG